MSERDSELKGILDKLAEWKIKHQVCHITMSIVANGTGYAYGWDGSEKVDVSALYKEETPAVAAARESK